MNSMNNFLSPRAMVGAAIVGIVGAAGVFIYEQIYAEKRRAMLVREVARLDKQVSSMRTELEALRELQKETNIRRLKQRRGRRERPPRPAASPKPAGDAPDAPEQSYASDSEYFTDYQSVLASKFAKFVLGRNLGIMNKLGLKVDYQSVLVVVVNKLGLILGEMPEQSYASDSEYFTDYQSVLDYQTVLGELHKYRRYSNSSKVLFWVKDVNKLGRKLSDAPEQSYASDSEYFTDYQSVLGVVNKLVLKFGDTLEQSYASDSEYFTDYQSVLGTDGELDSEEFYDVPTDEDEDDTLRESLRNGHAITDLPDEDSPKIVLETPATPVKNAT
ncbi:unnamed protein product [Chrysodeixis includens]|uniref:Uncharacterized protein n=1 Tax=Chrysodeixis includens TaxID=689277 RepID=A0A9N8L100_CHRIL|nr:unnamed protein product [Chrysodeixis includens]